MAKEDDRHAGKRENIWFPLDEHTAMLNAMAEMKSNNKSDFIRTAVANFITAYHEGVGKQKKGK